MNSNIVCDNAHNGLKPLWQVTSTPGVGKILIATEDIPAWKFVLKDAALIIGPSCEVVCLGCLKDIKDTLKCARCGWPVCSLECQEAEHHQAECRIFQESNFAPKANQLEMFRSVYSFIPVLRVLLLKNTDTRKWEMVKDMMDHWSERSQDPNVEKGVQTMTSFFRSCLNIDWISLEEVQHAYGVLKTNAVSFFSGKAQALYPLASIMSHSCAANLEPIKEPGETITFRAKRFIKKGEELTMRYADFLDSKYTIQEKLQKEWLFQCRCQRCLDESEFGSNFSSFKCCCGGFFRQRANQWKCSECCKDNNLVKNLYTSQQPV